MTKEIQRVRQMTKDSDRLQYLLDQRKKLMRFKQLEDKAVGERAIQSVSDVELKELDIEIETLKAKMERTNSTKLRNTLVGTRSRQSQPKKHQRKKGKRKELVDAKIGSLLPSDEDLEGYLEFIERAFWQEVEDLGLDSEKFYCDIKSGTMSFGIKTSTSKYVLCRARKKEIPFIFDNIPLLPISIFEKQFQPIIASPGSFPKTYLTGLKGVFRELPVLRAKYQRKDYFSIYVNPISSRGVDVLVLKEGEPEAVYDITNYAFTSFLGDSTVTRYLTNLGRFAKYAKCKRYFVASFDANLYDRKLKVDHMSDFRKAGVKVLIKGKQA
jgi:hypothetical protein